MIPLLHKSKSFRFLILVCFVQATLAQADCILPKYANWNTGATSGGYTPDYQYQLMLENHNIVPWFGLPAPGQTFPPDYYTKAITEAKNRQLPITLVSTQWESLLSQAPYLSISNDSNPNVLPVIGQALPKVSPFGDEKYWYEVGLKWTKQPVLSKLQDLYPNPPAIIFLSNNEHPKLQWYELELDKRYLKQPSVLGNLLDPAAKRDLIVQRWQKLYNALHQGMRDGLKNENWKKNAKFVGYLANGSAQLGINLKWELGSIHTNTLIDPYPLFWDGGSYSYYSKNDLGIVQNNPQIEAMNWVFMVKENKERNPNYYMELSVWDGHSYDDTDTRSIQETKQQGSSLASYTAMTKLGTWLLRPQIIREFRFYNETVQANKTYTDAVINTIDEINNSALLKTFWCDGELEANRTRQHPYTTNIPTKYAGVDRWYLLNSSANEQGTWYQNTRIKIFAIALKTGSTPNRKWLVYAHSTDSSIKSAEVEIPNYKKITLKPSLAGNYFIIDESSNSIDELTINPKPPQNIRISP